SPLRRQPPHLGNLVGTDITETHSLALFDVTGIAISGSPNTTIGGTSATAANVVAGNAFDFIIYSPSPGTVIEGNFIGVNRVGTVIPGQGTNGWSLLLADAATGTLIGGTAPGAGNEIAGPALALSGAGVHDNVIQGNVIST